ncbi:MAG: YbaK/EbsC family protein, partial [Firmicutes bacterium]|nr:YbaK/EbsC family protein [Bacillota bacterium]
MSYELAKAYLEKVGGMEYVHHRELYIDTVEDAARSIGCTEAEIAKSLTFMVGEQPVMIVMAGDTKVNSSKFKSYFHCKPSMIPRDKVQELVGHEPGGVCAFGIKDG